MDQFIYRIYPTSGCVITRWQGGFSVPDFIRGLGTTFQDPAWRSDLNYLHDWRGTHFPASLDFRSLSGYVRVQGEQMSGGREGVRVAVVVGTEEDFGVARQAVALLDQVSGDSIERRPFLDMAEACAWLGVRPVDVLPADDASL